MLTEEGILERRSRLKAFSSGALFRGCLSLVFWCAGVGFSPCKSSFAVIPSAHISPSFVSMFGSGLDGGCLEPHGIRCSVPSESCRSANPTHLAFVPLFVDSHNGVFRSVSMPMLTLTSGMERPPLSIFARRYSLQMKRIAASSVPAQMVDCKSTLYGSNEDFVRTPMNQYDFAIFFGSCVSDVQTPFPIPTPSDRINGDVFENELRIYDIALYRSWIAHSMRMSGRNKYTC